MTRRLPFLPALLSLALPLLAAPAGALGVLPRTIGYDAGGVLASVEVLGVVEGVPADGFPQAGSIAPDDTTLLLQGQLDAASDEALGFAVAVVDGGSGATRSFSGLGWLGPPAVGETPFSGAGGLGALGLPDAAGFEGPFFGGDTTVPFFVSYAEGPEVGDALLVAAGLDASAAGEASFVPGAAPIPEPGAFAATLLGLGLVGWRIRRLG